MNILDVFLPPRCLHCRQSMEKSARFCTTCLSYFTLLPKGGHCLKCAVAIPHMWGVCATCRAQRHPLKRLAVCFDICGPASSLTRAFEKTRHPELARDIASLMVIQLDAWDFPPFHCVTMVPNACVNPQYVVGRQLAQMLAIPFIIALKREVTPTIAYKIKRRCNLVQKRLLLLKITTTTRQPIQTAAHALAKGWPETVYGLTFCATC